MTQFFTIKVASAYLDVFKCLFWLEDIIFLILKMGKKLNTLIALFWGKNLKKVWLCHNWREKKTVSWVENPAVGA